MPKLPEDFIKKYTKLLGKQKADQLFNAISKNSINAYRINSLKEKQTLSYAQCEKIPLIPDAYYGKISGKDPEWVSGTVYSQEPAAMFPAFFLDAQPGEKILDLCAAPGGKSTAIGAQLKGQGFLLANEISLSRAKILRENLERWGVTNALITSEKPEKLSKYFSQYFDKILVDAPCSGEGMFRKDPQAIEYWSQDYVIFCQQRQKEILSAAVQMLKPGGELIYSTCTFAPEENEQIVSWLTKTFGFTIMPLKINEQYIDHGHPEWSDNNIDLVKTARFWPTANIGEGQYVAKLRLDEKIKDQTLTSTSKKSKHRKKPRNALTKSDIYLIAKVLDNFKLLPEIENWQVNCQVHNNHVFIPAINTNSDTHLKILANGVELGILKKNRFEPGHQLAMVLAGRKQNRVIDLSSNNYLKYLHGETIKTDSDINGFILVSFKNFILGFGKISNHIIKNYYPKGLRI